MASMTGPKRVPEMFKGRQFDRQIIVLCARWYVSYKLSSCDLGASPPAGLCGARGWAAVLRVPVAAAPAAGRDHDAFAAGGSDDHHQLIFERDVESGDDSELRFHC